MIQGWYCKGKLSTSLLGVKGVNLSCVIIAQAKSVTCWLEVFTTIFQNEISGYFLHGFQLQMGITIVVIIFDSLYNIKNVLFIKLFFSDDCSNFSTNPSGSIASPGFPISYPSNKNCVWIISAPTGKNMVLMFTQFDMRRSSNPPGCKEDFVEVQDGLTDLSPRIGGKFCNGNMSMLTITTTSTVRVNFHSGNTNAAQKGFQINYLAITPGIIGCKR